MYTVSKNKVDSKKISVGQINGYLMPSRNNKFIINNTSIRTLVVVDKGLSNPVVYKKVNIKYKKLIELLAELIVSEDDSEGDTYREILDRIEKFRLEIKNKYRQYLTKKELEEMAKGLRKIQKAAEEKYLVVNNVLERQEGKSR